MASYEGPVCPSFSTTLSQIKADESNMSNYKRDFQSQIDSNEGSLAATSLLFTESGLGSIVESEIPDEVIQLYERIFYSMLSPTYTDPDIFGGTTYIATLNDADIDPDEAAVKAAKIALAQAVGIYNIITPSAP
jgi:hypothetical protein